MNDTLLDVPIRVFLLIQNRLLRDALERLFRKRTDLTVVGRVDPDGLSRESLRQIRCDVAILEFFDSRRIPANPANPGCKHADSALPKLLLIGMSDESEQFLAAIRAGVAGYLLKEASAAEVVAAVRATFRGEAVCPPKLCAALFHYVSKAGLYAHGAGEIVAGRPSLTLRQQRLIALVADGLTNKEIACRLNISQFTVKNHIHRILRNVDADSRTQAVEAVRSFGYLVTARETV